uniref:AAA+ ATPase domain-containing protein n=1 Tax=Globodera rostochiensis TaxID=31243 RepID=A0A914GVV2_GLORO
MALLTMAQRAILQSHGWRNSETGRPKKVDEVVYQDEVVSVLKKCVQGADLPNLLFYGPPGTGKTSAAVALCRQLFTTAPLYKDRVLELNASDERGIDIVRHRIKDFSKVAISSARVGKDFVVPLKVIILDEADAMTGPAQSALRRTMESEAQTTRFFLICNYITRIIEPLTSRCAKFRFKPLSLAVQKQRLLDICTAESVQSDKDAIEELVTFCCGDLRKSITLLQSLASLGRQISVDDVRELSGQIPEKEVNLLLETAESSTHPEKILATVQQIVRKGYSVTQMLSQLVDVFLEKSTLDLSHQAKIFEKMAEAEKRLMDGADEYLQLLDVALTIHKCFVEAKIQ